MKFRLVAKTPTPATTLTITPTTVTVPHRPQRILDFDCEARPLSWIAADYVSKEITAIAWAWTDHPADVTCYLLGETDTPTMLRAFLDAYAQADLVTGHFIRGYDIPTINGALMEFRLPPLGDKMTHDTKIDLVQRAGVSVSQESLGAMFRLDHKKVKMTQADWRAANRLEPEGLLAARERVTGDVRQHIELRRELMALGYLGPPVKWKSKSTAPAAVYTP